MKQRGTARGRRNAPVLYLPELSSGLRLPAVALFAPDSHKLESVAVRSLDGDVEASLDVACAPAT